MCLNLAAADAISALIRLHARMAELCLRHGKYAIYSEHLQDTGNATTPDERAVVDGLIDAPYMRYYEDFLRGPPVQPLSRLGLL